MGWITLCHLPILWVHFSQLLAKPHYQFAVLLPFAAGLLLWQRLRDRDAPSVKPGRPAIAYALGALAVLVSVAAAWKWSPWIGMVGYLLNLLAILYWAGGSSLLRVAGPAWVVLWLALPAPFELDENLILRLRQMATSWTSDALHLLGILHTVAGNVIEIPRKAFFVADACTGIHSFFVLMAAALFLGLALRRRVVHVVLLVACSLCLVMVENVVRLTTVVVAFTRGWDWSEGLSHQILGLVLFILSLAMLLSADQFVGFVLPRESILAGWLSEVWGRFRSGGRSRSAGFQPAAPDGAFIQGLVAALAVVGALSIVSFPWASASQETASGSAGGGELPEFGAGFLPDRIQGFQRSEFRYERRNTGGLLSDRSQTWIYRGGNLNLQFSLDYPYSGVHKLLLCYQLTGWTVQTTDFITEPPHEGEGAKPAPFVETRMERPLEGYGYVFFSYFNPSGDEGVRLYPIHEPSARQRVAARIQSLFHRVDEKPVGYNIDLRGPTYQAQLLVRSPERLTDTQLADLRRFFVEGRAALRSNCVAAIGATAGGP